MLAVRERADLAPVAAVARPQWNVVEAPARVADAHGGDAERRLAVRALRSTLQIVLLVIGAHVLMIARCAALVSTGEIATSPDCCAESALTRWAT